MTTFPSLLLLTLAALSLSPLLDAAPAPAPVCPLAGSSSASLERLGTDPTAYQLSFRWNRRDIPVDYADFHYRINDGEFMNVRAYDGSTPATEAIHAVTLHPGDVLHAMVTYSTFGVGCDVAISEHRTSPPATTTSTHTTSATPISCNNIQQNLVHDGTTYNIHTTKPEHAQFVDAHYHVAGSYPVNIRMVPSSHTRGVYELPTPIRGDVSRITYYLTFSTGSMQCDTPTFATGTPEEPAPTDQIPAMSTHTRTLAASAAAAEAPPSRAAMPLAPAVAPAPVDIAPVAVTAPATAPAAATHTSIGPVAATPMAEPITVAAPAPAPAAAIPVEESIEPMTPVTAPAPAPAAVDTPAPVLAPPIAETVEAAGNAAAASEPPCAAGSIEHHVGQGANGDMVVAFNAAPGDAPYDKVEIYTLHGDDEANTPIGTNIAAGQSPPVHLGPGETLVYYITYSRGGVECKSAFFST